MNPLNNKYEPYERPGAVQSYRLAKVQVFKGSLVGLNGSGYAVPMSPDSPSLCFIGVAVSTVDNRSLAAGDRSVDVIKSGSFVYRAATFRPNLMDLASAVFAASDWEVQVSTTGLSHRYRVGTIVALETTSTGDPGVRIRIDRHTS